MCILMLIAFGQPDRHTHQAPWARTLAPSAKTRRPIWAGHLGGALCLFAGR